MHHNKLLFALGLLGLGSTCFAYSPSYLTTSNLYIGGELGQGDTHTRESTVFGYTSPSVIDRGLAGRLFFGSELSPYFAYEIGFARYSDTTINFHYSEVQFSQLSLDILAKLSVPVNQKISFYGKAGLAGVYQYNIKLNSDRVSGYDQYSRPMIGIGVSYNVDSKMRLDLGAYRIFGKDYLQDVDFVGVGVSFKLNRC